MAMSFSHPSSPAIRALPAFVVLALTPSIALADETPSIALVRAHQRGDRLILNAYVGTLSEERLVTLIETGSLPEKLAVLRGLAGAHDPIALLAPVARVMASREPMLAPAAAMALWTIATRLRPDALGEHTADEITAALTPALALADDLHVRPDLRAVAASLRASVRALARAAP